MCISVQYKYNHSWSKKIYGKQKVVLCLNFYFLCFNCFCVVPIVITIDTINYVCGPIVIMFPL